VERPILFSLPMVPAILAGTKTQTRRVVSMRTIEPGVLSWITRGTVQEWQGPGLWAVFDNPAMTSFVRRVRCLYGRSNDHLWVKEEYHTTSDRTHYRADGECGCSVPGWCRARYMPRRQSRLTLEITEIRVQRLCSIGQGDACAEGAPTPFEPLQWFEIAWEINGKRAPWSSNPWVWCISFRRVER